MWWRYNTKIQIHIFKNTNSGALLPAGRGRRPEPEHEGVQSGSLLVEELARVREGRSQRLLGQHEVLRRLSCHLVNTYVPILPIQIYIFIHESSSMYFTWSVDRKLRVNFKLFKGDARMFGNFIKAEGLKAVLPIQSTKYCLASSQAGFIQKYFLQSVCSANKISAKKT